MDCLARIFSGIFEYEVLILNESELQIRTAMRLLR